MKTGKLRCPNCKGKCQMAPGRMLRCLGDCGGLFDTTPSEGGDVHADPSKRMRLQEETALSERRLRRMR
jgi:hypothetical protein